MSVQQQPPDKGGRTTTEAMKAVYVGIAALVVLNVSAIIVFRGSPTTAAAIIGAVSAPIATLVGAYFGIKTGTDAGVAGKAEMEQSRDEAEKRTLALAAQMDPETGREALRALGVPVPTAPNPAMTTAMPSQPGHGPAASEPGHASAPAEAEAPAPSATPDRSPE
jgi:hypothetical protein